MAHFHSNALIGSGGLGGDTQYKIERSLRFNSADSSYLNRTPSSEGNRKTWTWSGWVKRCQFSTLDSLFFQDTGQYDFEYGGIIFNTDGTLAFNGYQTVFRRTSAVYKDPGAWMHIVVACDTTLSNADSRMRFYVNGDEITSWHTKNTITQDGDLSINKTSEHRIGRAVNAYANQYLTEIHFVDGQQLAASDFGEYDDNNNWIPKEFVGSHNVTVAAAYTGTVPSSTTDVPPAGSYQNGIATAAVLFGGTILTNGQNHIRQDGGGIEWSAAISLTSGDVAGAQCLYFNNTSAHTIQFKINGSWVDVQQNAQNVIGSTQGQGALITYTASGSVSWTGVRATGGSNISVTTVAGIFVNGNLVGENDTVGRNGFFLKFADNSSDAALGTDSSGNSNTWTVNNLTAVTTTANTSQTWSSSQTGYFSSNAANAFDGNLTTSAFATSGANANAYVDITAINASKVEVYISAYGSASAGAYYYCRQTNGTQHTYTISSSGTSLGWITVYDGSQISINRLGGARNSSAAAGSAQYGWRVDGVLLVNSGTAGFDPTGIDSLIDTPTNYEANSGNNGGNYCTLNPLDRQSTNGTLSNGNLDLTQSSAAWAMYRGTMAVSSGKWYYEINIGANQYSAFGILSIEYNMATNTNYWPSQTGAGKTYALYPYDGKKYDGTQGISYATANTSPAGSVYGVAFDLDNGTITFYKDGSTLGQAFTGISGTFAPAAWLYNQSNADSYNFGQRPFAHTPPTGHKALCTQNLADPTIAEGASVFDITLYTGNGSGQTISGLDFSPDWAWIKRRSGSTDHCINDTVRGAGKQLNINQNYAEVTNTNNFAAFTSDGFTVGNGSQTNAANPPETHVAWTWDAGESNTSITAASLNSTAYNTDRVWSNGITNSNSDFDQAKTNAFNGNRSNMLRTGSNQVLVTLDFSPALTVSNSIEILGEGWPTAAATFVFTVDGSTTTKTTTQGRPATFDVSGSLTRITMQNSSSSGRTYLTYIKVDGKELIDSNITPPNIPSIASTVRANQSAGFSIVSYQGNNTGGATIGHGLNAQPKFIVVKDRDSTSGWWAVYHDGVGAGKGGYLNDGQAFSAQSHWSYSDPSSSVFYVGANANTNANQNDFIAYCFAPVEGYSAFGSYLGNGSADGPFIYTGFRPRWLMIKSSSNSGEDWLLLDTSRDPSNTANSTAMYASQRHADNSTNAITTNILSNGFKCIGTNAATNASGYTYIYHAFAEHPFKTARAR